MLWRERNKCWQLQSRSVGWFCRGSWSINRLMTIAMRLREAHRWCSIECVLCGSILDEAGLNRPQLQELFDEFIWAIFDGAWPLFARDCFQDICGILLQAAAGCLLNSARWTPALLPSPPTPPLSGRFREIPGDSGRFREIFFFGDPSKYPWRKSKEERTTLENPMMASQRIP